MSRIILRAFTGKITCDYYHNPEADSEIAIILHGPRPEDEKEEKVVNTIFETFVKNNFSTLCIDFSPKANIKDEEEKMNADIFDSTISLNWLYEKNPETKACWIIGYDKAALTALQLVMRRPEIENYLLISPNFTKNDLGFVVPCMSYGCLMKGENFDDLPDDEFLELQEKLSIKTEKQIETIYAPTDYKTTDSLETFEKTLDEYIKNRLTKFLVNTKAMYGVKKRRRKKKLDDQNDLKMNYVNPIKPLDLDNI